MKILILASLICVFAAGCRSNDIIETNDGFKDIRLNGKPMSIEQVEHYTESKSKRNTKFIIIHSDGSAEHMTLGEFMDQLDNDLQEKDSTVRDNHTTIILDDPFAPPTKH